MRRGRVEGKVAIVTGAGSTPGPGMATGRATAIVLAREGASVVVADIAADRAEETTAIIEDEGGRATVFVGDLTRAADCAAMVGAAVLVKTSPRPLRRLLSAHSTARYTPATAPDTSHGATRPAACSGAGTCSTTCHVAARRPIPTASAQSRPSSTSWSSA